MISCSNEEIDCSGSFAFISSLKSEKRVSSILSAFYVSHLHIILMSF